MTFHLHIPGDLLNDCSTSSVKFQQKQATTEVLYTCGTTEPECPHLLSFGLALHRIWNILLWVSSKSASKCRNQRLNVAILAHKRLLNFSWPSNGGIVAVPSCMWWSATFNNSNALRLGEGYVRPTSWCETNDAEGTKREDKNARAAISCVPPLPPSP